MNRSGLHEASYRCKYYQVAGQPQKGLDIPGKILCKETGAFRIVLLDYVLVLQCSVWWSIWSNAFSSRDNPCRRQSYEDETRSIWMFHLFGLPTAR